MSYTPANFGKVENLSPAQQKMMQDMQQQGAIVANFAGTTRDVNRVRVRYHNRDIELLDTAGIRRNGKIETGIEKFSVLRTLQAIEAADVCLLLLDANEHGVALDQILARPVGDKVGHLLVAALKVGCRAQGLAGQAP